MTKLSLSGLSVRAEDETLVREVSLEFGPGECVAILGANGAGKTTLLRAGLGLIQPDEGEARLA